MPLDVLVTVLALTCVAILLLSETYYFFAQQRMDTIIVDHSLSVPFPIYMDIIFPYLSCAMVTIDLVDDQEHPVPVLAHDVRKHRINMRGQDLTAAQSRAMASSQSDQQGSSQATVKSLGDKVGTDLGSVSDDCMPCSDSWSFSSEKCCDCNSVREYYRKRDDDTTYTTHPLCIRDHSKKLLDSLKEHSASVASLEGCRVRGYLLVPRVRANLHVSANINQLRAAKMGTAKGKAELTDQFRVQHVIRELRFGEEFEGQASPLAGVELYDPGLLRHIYLIKLVPTRYEGAWIPVDSYQYTFAPHTEKIDTSQQHWHLPGVYFRYDFSPMMALLSTRYSHFSTYITRIFALVGGLWVVLGVIYRMGNKVVSQVNTKKNQ